MIEQIKTITEEEINEKGVCAAPTILTGTPEENKKIFDRLSREVVIPRLNSLIEESKALEQNSTENAQAVQKLEETLDGLIDGIGDISAVELSGENLCEKIKTLKDAFLQSVLDINRSVGELGNLDFIAPSVVGALNLLYEMASQGAVISVSSLGEPKADDLMKVVKIFDVSEGKHRIYVCNAKFPETSGLFAGDLCGRLYFDPYVIKERYASFRSANLEKFTDIVDRKHYMNVVTFVSPTDENDKAYLQIRYSTSLDGYVLAFSKGENYDCIWASDNFKMDGISYTEGYAKECYTDLFSGYLIESVEEDISWLTCKDAFESEFYWEELGSSNIVGEESPSVETDISVSKSGRYTTLVLTKGENTKSVVIEDGYIPVKGQDYWTEEDKTSMVEDVLAELQNASGVSF